MSHLFMEVLRTLLLMPVMKLWSIIVPMLLKSIRIYESALKQDVIVNMPSNSHKELLFWLTQNGLNQAEFFGSREYSDLSLVLV